MSFKVKCIIFLLLSLIGAMLYFSIFPYVPNNITKSETVNPSLVVQDS